MTFVEMLRMVNAFGGLHAMRIVTVLFQSTLILGAAYIITGFLRKYTASLRFGVIAATLMVLPFLPVVNEVADTVMMPTVSVPVVTIPERDTTAYERVEPQILRQIETPDRQVDMHSVPVFSETPVSAEVPVHQLPWAWVLLLYMGGVFFLLAGIGIGIGRVRRWIVKGHPVAESHILEIISDISAYIGITAPVRVIVSARSDVPFVAGVWRPVLVLPAGFADSLDAEELRAVVMHELAHVKRGDQYLLPLLSVVQALFWFHPAVWVMFRECRLLAEKACDEAVVALTGSSRQYAGLLTRMAETVSMRNLPKGYTVGLFSGHVFRRRIKTIIDLGKAGIAHASWKLSILVMLITATLFSGVVLIHCTYGNAQTDIQDQFATADSLYAADQWIAAIDEYSRFLDSDRADYALYMIGMCKDAIATNQNEFFFREKFGDKPEMYSALRKYVTNRRGEFRPFSPEGIQISNGAEFKRILADYPKSDYVDDSAYMLLLQSLHSDWEGYVPIMVGLIERCKAYLQYYPTSEYTDDVVERCVQFYEYIQEGKDMTLAERLGYARDLERFKQEWGYTGQSEDEVQRQARIFESSAPPDEGIPVFVAKYTTSVYLEPYTDAVILRKERIPAGQRIKYDLTRYRTVEPGSAKVLTPFSGTARSYGAITYFSRDEYFGTGADTTLNLTPGDTIEYLQELGEGAAFIRMNRDVMSFDLLRHAYRQLVEITAEPVTEWWVRVVNDTRQPIGWVKIEESTIDIDRLF